MNNKLEEFNCGKTYYLRAKSFINNYLSLNKDRKVDYPITLNVTTNNDKQTFSFQENEVQFIVLENLRKQKLQDQLN